LRIIVRQEYGRTPSLAAMSAVPILLEEIEAAGVALPDVEP
jgi:hypothetical protein